MKIESTKRERERERTKVKQKTAWIAVAIQIWLFKGKFPQSTGNVAIANDFRKRELNLAKLNNLGDFAGDDNAMTNGWTGVV